jgi:hypothetical protein
MIMLEQIHRTFEHETAHLSRDEQISLAIHVASSFNSTASDLMKERDEEHGVDGVVRGSSLERQIQLARREIATWPESVKRAMKIQDE